VTFPITVVVPAYGDAAPVAALVAELDQQAPPETKVRVIVSDDASPTPLEPVLRTLRLDRIALDVVRSERNSGPGGARNRALEHVQTDWVAFLDADEVPGSGWLKRLLEIAHSGSLDAVEGRIESGSSAGPFTHTTEVRTGGAYLGGNVAFRTAALRAVGGFDERFYDARRKLHFREDADLFFRLEASGTRIGFDPCLHALHPPLPASYTATLRLARRYYFDALLSRKHPQRFHGFVRARRMGPVPLRRARHDAYVMYAAGTAAAAAGVMLQTKRLAVAGGAVASVGWLASAAALAWGRRVGKRDVVPLAGAAAVTPWVYLLHYYRGVVTFRHRPRL
jgi:glycosyltransferase involved in cell wall biosynthesis